MNILASLQIADYEIRLLVGEFKDGRFNMLHLETTKCDGIVNKEIINSVSVKAAIQTTIEQAQKKLGFHLHKVLLVVPSIGFNRTSKRVNVFIGENSLISDEHINMGIDKFSQQTPSDEVVLVNLAAVKFITNGISSRKKPTGDKCEVLTIEADCLYASKTLIFEYVGIVEKCGLKVLDICLDAIALGEEAAIFEQSLDRFVIGIGLERQSTTLALYHKGSLVNCETLDHGYGDWAMEIKEQYGFSSADCYRLLNNALTFDVDEISDTVVHLWSENGETKYLTERELVELVINQVRKWIEKINDSCLPIIEKGSCKYVISGSGAQIIALKSVLNLFNADTGIYVPQTIGARNPTLSECLGAVYNYYQNYKTDNEQCSVDVLEIDKLLEQVKRGQSDGTFTRKLKKIFNN